jgi:hypothetical protein
MLNYPPKMKLILRNTKNQINISVSKAQANETPETFETTETSRIKVTRGRRQPPAISVGMIFFALAALADTSSPARWLRVVLAGLAVGMAVTEGADIGALGESSRPRSLNRTSYENSLTRH